MSYPPSSPPGWTPPPPPPTYGGRGYGQPVPGLASYGRRVVAHIVDNVMVYILVVIAVIVLVTGDTEYVTCDIDSEGNVVLFESEDDVRPGICERPTGGTFALAGVFGLASVAFWFAYHAWEGATGKSVGKLMMGIRLVDQHSLEPIGGWKGVGRGVVETLIGTFSFGIASIVSYLWPLWDDDRQTLHDKTVSSVVVHAEHMVPKGTALARVQAGWNAHAPTAAAWAPPAGGTPPVTPPTWPAAPPPGAAGSPLDPHGRPPTDPFS